MTEKNKENVKCSYCGHEQEFETYCYKKHPFCGKNVFFFNQNDKNSLTVKQFDV